MNQGKEFKLGQKEALLLFGLMIGVSLFSFGLGLTLGREKPWLSKSSSFVDENKTLTLKNTENPQDQQIALLRHEIEKLSYTLQDLKNPRPAFREEPLSLKQAAIKRPRLEITRPLKKDPKYTIRLGNAFESESDAKMFAKGIALIGYDAMVRPLDSDLGPSLRQVVLNVFDSKEEAERYVQAEGDFFQDQKYEIVEF